MLFAIALSKGHTYILGIPHSMIVFKKVIVTFSKPRSMLDVTEACAISFAISLVQFCGCCLCAQVIVVKLFQIVEFTITASTVIATVFAALAATFDAALEATAHVDKHIKSAQDNKDC